MCPHCRSSVSRLVKKGFFHRRSGHQSRIQRFFCRDCCHYSSTQTGSLNYRQKKPHLHHPLFIMLSSGVSQRRCAIILGTTPVTVARKAALLGTFARRANQRSVRPCTTIVFDEMETFEHSKCKPLSIALAVEEHSRHIISAELARMPAKGHLAAIARRRYGYRPDRRKQAIKKVFARVKSHAASDGLILKSDQSPRYPRYVQCYLPGVTHLTYKGRRGCVVGQGELKRGGFDPLFSLNHTCAMFRDNLKRLSRRTWCTTKKPKRLQHLLDLYTFYHNQKLESGARPTLRGLVGAGM